MSDYLIQRNNYYYYFRRVPKHVAPYDSRSHVKISLKTKDLNTARKRAIVHNETIEKFWRQLVAVPEESVEQDMRYRKAVQTARIHGFTYRDITDISANAELGEVVDRMLALKGALDKKDNRRSVRHALTGTAESPKVLLSQTFDIFRPRCVDRLSGKTEHQIRKWENPRRLAIENFINAIGDKNISEITRKDILDFQEWWLARIREEGLKSDSANRNFRHVKDILDNVFIAMDLEPGEEIETLFTKIKLKPSNNSRSSYEATYVQEVLLGSDALNGMNAESRALVYMMADTGARVAEIVGLMAEDIRLDAPIPFIHIRSNERHGLKTAHSDRQIPLVGAALHAAQQFPDGLSRYSTADSASSQINKYLRENNLNPTENHSLYSLRHTFKDRLRDIQAPEEVIDNLMGHKARGPKYGRGHILETKVEWLDKIAFKAPENR